MEKIQIIQAFNCNQVILNLFQKQSKFPVSIGFKLLKISKMFDEVEEYVFAIMETTFKNFCIENMTDDQKLFFNKLMGEEIELEYNKIPISAFQNNDELKLSLDDLEKLMIILEEKKE